MPYVTTRDGTQLFARRWGDGPPIVFVHGWALDSSLWQSAMTLAAQAGFTAIAYDRRSHGRSDDPGRGYDFDTLADDLADHQERIARRILRTPRGLEDWIERNREAVARLDTVVANLQTSGAPDLARLTVAERVLREMLD